MRAEPRFENLDAGCKVYCKYMDHVMFSRSDPNVVSPQIRERRGWLVYNGPDHVTIVSDRDSGPPTLRGGDAKADGLVVLKACILELKAD